MAYIYGHYTTDTDKLFYIGKGTGRRAWSRRQGKHNPHWAAVVKKHGYTVKILFDNLSDEEAFMKEKELIAEIGVQNLTNMTDGGEGFTSESMKHRWQDASSRERMLANRTFYNDPEWLRQVSEAGRNSAQDPEWKRKNNEAAQRRAHDPVWKNKQRDIALHNAQTPEWQAAYAAGLVKRSNNPEWKRKQVELRAKTYVGLVSPEGVVYKDIYNLSEFARTHNLTARRLRDVLQKKRNHHKGWTAYTPV